MKILNKKNITCNVVISVNIFQDFSTRSLNMSEETPGARVIVNADEEEENDENVLVQYQMRRTWESRYYKITFIQNKYGLYSGFFNERNVKVK